MPRPSNPLLEQKLLDVGLGFLAERGEPKFSMREVAAAVGYTVTAVYRHYKSKEDFLVAMQLFLFHQLNTKLSLLKGDNTREQIEKIGEAFVIWGLSHPAYYRFMFQSTTLLKPADQPIA